MSRKKRRVRKAKVEQVPPEPSRRRVTLLGILLVAIPIAATLIQIYRVWPFADDVPMALSSGDDWFMYKEIAQLILHKGIEIPRGIQVYGRPAGFLYGYFVAAIFAVLGENSTMVYVVQAALLGVAVVILFLAFRDRFPRWMLLPVLVLQTSLMYWEVGRWFSMRILSENLLCILVPWAMFFLVRAYRSEKVVDLVLAGVFTGLCHLARPNAILMMPFAAIVLAIYFRRNARPVRRLVGLFVLGAMLGTAPLVVRNVYVTHTVSLKTFSPLFIRPKKGGTDWAYFLRAVGIKRKKPRRGSRRPDIANPKGMTFFVDRALFVTGIRTYAGPAPHWILMWLGVAFFGVASYRRRRLEYEDALLAAMIVALLGPLIFGGTLTSYGARFMIGGTPLLLLLGLRGIALALPSSRSPESG